MQLAIRIEKRESRKPTAEFPTTVEIFGHTFRMSKGEVWEVGYWVGQNGWAVASWAQPYITQYAEAQHELSLIQGEIAGSLGRASCLSADAGRRMNAALKKAQCAAEGLRWFKENPQA